MYMAKRIGATTAVALLSASLLVHPAKADSPKPEPMKIEVTTPDIYKRMSVVFRTSTVKIGSSGQEEIVVVGGETSYQDKGSPQRKGCIIGAFMKEDFPQDDQLLEQQLHFRLDTDNIEIKQLMRKLGPTGLTLENLVRHMQPILFGDNSLCGAAPVDESWGAGAPAR